MEFRRSLSAIPPVYYPGPNPHLDDLISLSHSPKTVDSPYSGIISAGKNTYVYDAHTYHTKVPPQGIGLLIDYYTNPGDTVLDPFCGSGMTGIAAVEKGRQAILTDLSPAATFIAYNLLTPISSNRYLEAVYSLLEQSRELNRQLYSTRCRTCGREIPMLYMVWSYGAICEYCNKEFILWDVARDERSTVRESKIKSQFPCPYCSQVLQKRRLTRTQRYPVLVGYHCCEGGLQEAKASPTDEDLMRLKAIKQDDIRKHGLWYPTDPFPAGVNTRQAISAGITSVDKAYTPRALWAMAYLWNAALKWPDPEVRMKLLFTLTSLYKRVTVFSEFRFWGGSGNTANYSVPSIMNEQNVFVAFERKAHTISWYFDHAPNVERRVRISTQPAAHLAQLPDKSIDYVFTDPPFGGNINYSEMNFLWESWLGCFTNNTEEAIINKVQGKGVKEYEKLIRNAFVEINRVLKDDGWFTILFHNSSAKVWNALQNALTQAGFSIQGTQVFDKKHGTFKQFVSDNAVGYNLVLHCRKAKGQQAIVVSDKSEVYAEVKHFVRTILRNSDMTYRVKYLHVDRNDEFDYRRLYAEWLAQTVPRKAINLGFPEFRSLVDEVIHEDAD